MKLLLALAFLLAAIAAPRGIVNAAEDGPAAIGVAAIHIQECWIGSVTNDGFGSTTVEFDFFQIGKNIQRGRRTCSAASSCGSVVFFGDLDG